MSVLLQKQQFTGISQKELAEQIEAKNKCLHKLPKWYNSPSVYFPNKLNIEQTSSEKTATYKSNLFKGKKAIDITGGFGVDTYYFSKHFEQVFHCEINERLSEIAAHNFNVFEAKNITSIKGNGVEYILNSDTTYDLIFADPSRRNDSKEKVFFLNDCLPNIPLYVDELLKKTDRILIKTSPLLDISTGLKELKFTTEIHVVAVQNEVKELLWILEKKSPQKTRVTTVNLTKKKDEIFAFYLEEEKEIEASFSTPLEYLYEPNSAILKAGAFKCASNHYKLLKLHEHSHLYTSHNLVDFPGRVFKINEVVPYSKKAIQKLKITKANITTRNFKESVSSLRKKYKIKDGGDTYLFFTTNSNNESIMINCSKIDQALL